jgi:hypothetical protein
MVLKGLRVMLVVAVVLAVWGVLAVDTGQAQTKCYRRPNTNQLFYNYYVPPAGGGVGAQLYLAPRPTPPWVGHTYVTYQPLMPHEFLYPHHRAYWRKHPDGRWTRTLVWWQ